MDSLSFTKHSLLGTVVNCNKPLAKSHTDRIILVFRLVVALLKSFLSSAFFFVDDYSVVMPHHGFQLHRAGPIFSEKERWEKKEEKRSKVLNEILFMMGVKPSR